MFQSFLGHLLLALSLSLFLAACETAEERAEGHYQAALKLVEQDDVPRALVELRNVFKLNGKHREARLLYARFERESGDLVAAFRQYLRAVEQYPDDLIALKNVSELAIEQLDWEVAERYVPDALAQAPEDVTLRAIAALLDYRKAQDDKDEAGVASAVAEAEAVIAEDPSQTIARQVLIDSLLQDTRLSSALEQIEISLESRPDDLRLHEVKLKVLSALKDNAAVGAHLEEMISRFPDNEQIRNLLIRWYVTEDQPEKAETFLRQFAGTAAPEDKRDSYLTLVRFLQQTSGNEVALKEIESLVAAGQNPVYYGAMAAAIRFDQGAQNTAITDLRRIVEGAEPSPDLNDAKGTLAQMLQSTGDQVGARALVEEVLAADSGHVQTLQMRAAWQIEDDQPGEAIANLRTALDGNPNDTRTLTLMAQAHLRDGSRQLAGERLAKAVEVSNDAAPESLRYARFLLEDDLTQAAEAVLTDALRRSGGNADLLSLLGDIYLSQQDWLRLEGVITALKRSDAPQNAAAANQLQTAMLLSRGQTDEGIRFIEELIDSGEASQEAVALVVQSHLSAGDLEAARSYLAKQRAKVPDNDNLRAIEAALLAATGDLAGAEAIYRDLMAKDPDNEALRIILMRLLNGQGRSDEAKALLEEGLAPSEGPVAPELSAIKAAQLEQSGDVDGAIAIYEDLYGQYSNNVVLANNLASLLASYRDDPTSLNRAAVVARRLRGTEVPAMQDTYGWIQYRAGNIEEAIAYLEPAATGLPQDPLVQVHLGLAYVEAGRTEEARSTLTRALEIAGDDPRKQFATARETLDALPVPQEGSPQKESTD